MLQQMVVCVGFWHCLLEQRLFQQEMVVELDAGLLQGAHVVVPFNLEDGVEEPPMFIVQLGQVNGEGFVPSVWVRDGVDGNGCCRSKKGQEKPSLHGEEAEKHCSQATEDYRQRVCLYSQ